LSGSAHCTLHTAESCIRADPRCDPPTHWQPTEDRASVTEAPVRPSYLGKGAGGAVVAGGRGLRWGQIPPEGGGAAKGYLRRGDVTAARRSSMGIDARSLRGSRVGVGRG
jgi:hypothetical protein